MHRRSDSEPTPELIDDTLPGLFPTQPDGFDRRSSREHRCMQNAFWIR